MRHLLLLSSLSICFIIGLAHASETDFTPPSRSTINISGGYDTDKNKDYSLFLDLEFQNFHRFSAGYFRNESSLDNTATDNYNLSASTSSYEITSLDTSLNYIELSDAMESYIFSSTINLNLENWHFSITPQLNSMTFYLNDDRENKFDIYAKGAEISASYFGLEQYYFSANYFRNDFSEKPIFLRPAVFDSLTTRTIDKIRIISRISELTSSLEQQHIILSAGRQFNWGSLDLSLSYAELFNLSRWLDFPALDAFKDTNYITTYTASSDIVINKQLSIGVSLGWQAFSNDSDSLLFTSSALSYSW